jgi:hypothetical protein
VSGCITRPRDSRDGSHNGRGLQPSIWGCLSAAISRKALSFPPSSSPGRGLPPSLPLLLSLTPSLPNPLLFLISLPLCLRLYSVLASLSVCLSVSLCVSVCLSLSLSLSLSLDDYFVSSCWDSESEAREHGARASHAATVSELEPERATRKESSSYKSPRPVSHGRRQLLRLQ